MKRKLESDPHPKKFKRRKRKRAQTDGPRTGKAAESPPGKSYRRGLERWLVVGGAP
jgi:hypothetical protein